MKKLVIYSLCLMFSFAPLSGAQEEGPTELVSLDLKGMDINDVLKIISQKSGLNIVADRDVRGKVSLYLKDVDILDALDILVSTNGLAYEREGTLIRIMTDKKYEKLYGEQFQQKTETEIIKLDYMDVGDAVKAIDQMKSTIGKIVTDTRSGTIVIIDNPDNIERMKTAISEIDVPLSTEVFSLDYANAEEIKGKLDEILSDGAGNIRFDARTNKLMVESTAEKLDEVKGIVEAFDEKTREVVIDANIIQVTLADKYSYGIDWADVAKLGDIVLTSDTNLSTGLTNVTPSTFTVASVGTNYTSILSLLKTFGETNVLSRPRITVADKEDAKILVGAKEVYVTSEVTTTEGGTYSTADSVEFVDVGVSLTVTPEINKAGFVRMKIKPEVSATDSTKTVTLTNPDGSTRSIVPYVTTSEAETTVLAKDNTTIIIGGLMKETIVDHMERIPFFADLPFIGKLFTTKGKSKEKTELVILLTPHIIEGDEVTDEAKVRMEEWDDKRVVWEEEEKEETPPRKDTPQRKKEWLGKKEPGEKAPAKLKRADGDRIARHFGVEPKRSKYVSVEKEVRPDKVKKKEAPATKIAYEEYYLVVVEEVNSMARRQDVSGIKGEVELRFTLDKDGFLMRGPVVLNKPDLALVRAAVNCIKLSAPFPMFPRKMKRKEAQFFVVVRYE